VWEKNLLFLKKKPPAGRRGGFVFLCVSAFMQDMLKNERGLLSNPLSFRFVK